MQMNNLLLRELMCILQCKRRRTDTRLVPNCRRRCSELLTLEVSRSGIRIIENWSGVRVRVRASYTISSGGGVQSEREGLCGNGWTMGGWLGRWISLVVLRRVLEFCRAEMLNRRRLLLAGLVLMWINILRTSSIWGRSWGLSRVHRSATPSTIAIFCWWAWTSFMRMGSSTFCNVLEFEIVERTHSGKVWPNSRV